ncbi:hypothetical protein HZS55_08675 [Halosimplex rubrum]|uniref:Uncharacterized protein n=1 Tax=Halosimplex rubrum TaxID=869889 RepID=A0A7D5P4N1_9EURY|nr:hypothetical protein [Halosimplex rubrum]QLH77362.1 hypothetical protein HZS55_08675 [Halosimplex rubrum]
MATRRALSTLSLACLLVLAGCGAPFGASTTPDPTPAATGTEPGVTSTATPDGSEPSATERGVGPGDPAGVGESRRVAVRGGELPFNATVVYRRVERLLGVDEPVPEVVVGDRDAFDFSAIEPRPYQAALGLQAGSVSDCATFYSASGGDPISITQGTLSAEAVELIFVHELGHTFQGRASGSVDMTELGESSTYLTGGVAVYTTDRYAERYDKRWNGSRPVDVRECVYDEAPGAYRQTAGEIYFGARYVEERVDEPTNLSAVFESPPESAEAVVHRLEPGAEPVRSLDVRVDGGDRWAVGERRRAGEIELRAWLHAGLPDDQVDTAATGWGADRLVRFGDDTDPSVAWVLRMDSAGDADELADAVADLETDLESRNATELRSTRVGEATVVAFAGTESFVANATAGGTAGNVTVAAP